MFTRLAVVTLTLLVAGCGDETPSAEATGWTPTQVVALADDAATASGAVFAEGPRLPLPSELTRVGDLLVVADVQAQPVLHAYDVASGQHRASFGELGEGPGQFQMITALGTDSATGHLLVYDGGLRRIVRIDLDDAVANPGASSGSPSWLVSIGVAEAGGTVVDMAWNQQGVAAATGLLPEGRLASFRDTTVSVWGTPPPGAADVPNAVRQHAYQSFIAASPSRPDYAVVTRHASLLEIYDGAGKRTHLVDLEDSFRPVYEVTNAGGRPVMASGDDLRFGYVGVSATDEHIVALFSGRLRGDAPGIANYGNRLLYFDWDGNLLTDVTIPDNLIAVYADGETQTVYGIRHEPSSAVLSYPFPESL